MKYWKWLLLSSVMIANISFSTSYIIDKVVAIVNNSVILQSDIDHFLQFINFNKNYHIDKKFLNDDILRYSILEHLIINQIILQIGRNIGIEISDKKIDQVISNIARNNNISIDQICNYLSYNGINYETYRNQIYKEILISEVYDREILHKVIILPQEVEALLKKINNKKNITTNLNLSYILIKFPENPTYNQIIEAENKARLIIRQVYNDSDLFELAIVNSTTDQQILQYDQISWKQFKKLPFISTRELNAIKKGEVIGPIYSNTGFYIFKLNDLCEKDQTISITQAHIRHILLKTSSDFTDNQAKEKLEEISQKIRKGEITFSDAAKKFSQDYHSSNHGGDLGWIEINTCEKNFRNALLNLEKFKLSAPIHSSLGWSIIELLDIREIKRKNITQREKIYQMLLHRKFLEEEESWVQEQHDNAYIKILS